MEGDWFEGEWFGDAECEPVVPSDGGRSSSDITSRQIWSKLASELMADGGGRRESEGMGEHVAADIAVKFGDGDIPVDGRTEP